MKCDKNKPAYAFIKLDEDGVKIQLSNDLEEFKQFCHYGFSPSKEALEMLEATGVIGWNGNDTWYYIMQHETWRGLGYNINIHVIAKDQ